MKINEGQKFILVLFILSLVVRLGIAPIYVDPPETPHDFKRYLDSAKTVLQGKILYVDYSPDAGGPSLYGPLYSVLNAAWIGIFSDDYTLFKFPSILLDVLSIVLIFYIVKSIANLDAAKYASVLYAFSYVALASSAVEGNDDHGYVFFSLVAILYLVKSSPNLTLSAIFMGVAISFKLLPLIIFALPIIFYVYQKNGTKAVFKYALLSMVTLAAIYMPFYLKAGLNVLYPYIMGAKAGFFGESPLAGLNWLVNYFTLADWTQTLEIQNPIVEKLALPFMLFGLFFALFYMLKFRIQNKEYELFRNFFLFTFVVFIFGKIMYDSIFIGIVPTAVILFTVKTSGNFRTSRSEIAGVILVLIGILIHSYIYRERIDYSSGQRLLLALGILFSFAGTYLTMIENEFKFSWSLAVLSFAAFGTMHADFLLLIGPVIPLFRDYRMAWGTYAFGMPIIFTISMILLFYKVHEKISVKIRA
jgi:hypothetical protein